jgi:hypothetical protein
MLDLLQLYVSSFWVWLGITIGLAVVLKFTVILVAVTLGVLRGHSVDLWRTVRTKEND